jgi:hypothetical protein
MAPPHSMQLAGRADWALVVAIHDALPRDLDQPLHATASHASARAPLGTFRSQLRFHLAAGPADMWNPCGWRSSQACLTPRGRRSCGHSVISMSRSR